jgi:hypothetical protein
MVARFFFVFWWELWFMAKIGGLASKFLVITQFVFIMQNFITAPNVLDSKKVDLR